MVEKEYTAFISYRHQLPDMEIAQKLHTAIETYRIPGNIRRKTGKQKMGRVFRDQEELPLSANLGEDIETALDHSEWFIAICSPCYQESLWCMRELTYFIEKHGRSRVLTVLTEDEPADSFPDQVLYLEDENGSRQPVEPLAADVRGKTTAEMLKKLKKEKLRLLAPILNVTYDDLRLREQQRRKKRIVSAAAAVVLAGGALTGILLRNAALRREALEQQHIAEEQQRIAEEQQRIAEEERRTAVSNSVGESLSQASALLDNQDHRRAAAVLLDALALSEENSGLRRDEILVLLRKSMSIAPYSVVSHLDLPNLQLSGVKVSPDGKRLISISNGNSVIMIDLEAGKAAYTVSKGNSQIDEIAFSPDGSRFLAINDFCHYVTVWNTEDGQEIYTYTGRTDEQKKVSNALFFQGPDTLLLRDGEEFFLISVPDGTAKPFYTFGNQQDGYTLSKALHGFIINDFLEGYLSDLSPYKDLFIGCPMIVSRDGEKVLISGQTGETGTIVLNSSGERIALLDRMPGMLGDAYDLSPDGKYVACQSKFGFAAIWDAGTGRLRWIKDLSPKFSDGMSYPVFSPDSSHLAFMLENKLYVMDVPNGNQLLEIEVGWKETFPPEVRWSSDGKYLILMTPDLYMVDAETHNVLLSLIADTDNAFNNAVPIGNDFVFVSRQNGEAVLYSLPGISSISFRTEYRGSLDASQQKGEPWEEEPAGQHQMNDFNHVFFDMTALKPDAYYSPDGEYAALLYDDGAIEVFRKEDIRHVYLLNKQYVYAPNAFTFVNGHLAAAEKEGGIMFQDLANQHITILNKDAVYTSFCFRGNLLMAIRKDQCTVDVFDVDKTEHLISMQSAVPFKSFAFSESGEEAIALAENGEYVVADLLQNESALLERAKRFVPGD